MHDESRHPNIIEASRRFAEAAREAQEKGEHGRAAALFRAALLLLKGEASLDQVPETNGGRPSDEASWIRVILSRSR